MKDNIDAFRFGRHYENLKEEVINIVKDEPEILEGFDAKYQNRFKFLEDYQNKKYAQNYEDLVSYAKKVDKEVGNGSQFSTAVLKNYFKLMAYKDEYEVSRLMTNKKFSDDINKNFEGNFSYNFYLAPPIFSKKSKVDGKLLKIKFGGWLFNVFKLISKFKFLRGTKFDPFGYLNERKKERELIRDYKQTIVDIGSKINKSNYETAVKIASIPDQIRGFGHVKEKNIKEAINNRTDLLNSFHENS